MPAVWADTLDGAGAQIAIPVVLARGTVHCRVAAVQAPVKFAVAVFVVEAEGFSYFVACVVQVFGHPGRALDFHGLVSLAVTGIGQGAVFDRRIELCAGLF